MSEIEVRRVQKKVICIDFDGTYSEYPDLWDEVIRKMRDKGIKVIGCTMRFESETVPELERLKKAVNEMYFTGRKAKKPFLEGMHIFPEIWIDDNPEWIYTDAI